MPKQEGKDVQQRFYAPWHLCNPTPRPVVQVWVRIPMTKTWLLMDVIPVQKAELVNESA